MARLLGRLLAAALLPALAAGLLPPAGAAFAQESLLRVRLNADIRSTDPGTNRDGNTDMVVLHVVEGLVAFREDTSVGPLLAESVDTSADGLTYTFTLRQGVRFHNGEALTSADFRFVWDRYMRAETNWRCRPDFDGGITRVTAVETPDPRTVVMRLDRPSALFLATLARADCGQTGIYQRASLNPDGSWNAPVGTGPFRMGEWRRGQQVEVLRFLDYAALPGEVDGHTGNKTAFVDRVRFVVINDAAAAKAALLSGSVDLVPDVSNEDVEEYRRRNDVSVSVAPTMDLQAVLFQTRDPLFQDVRMRRAVALALDVPELVSAVSAGLAQPNRSPIPIASAAHTAAQGVVPARDLEGARQLLREAGYRGQPVRLITTRRYEAFYNIAVVVQAQAQEAGLNLEIEVLDWATQLDRYNRGDYQMMSFGYSARLEPALSFELFTGPKERQPRKLWDDQAVQALLDESIRITDRTRRQAIFDELFARLLSDVPMIALYQSTDVSAVRRNVTGYRGWATGQPRLWGVRLAN